MAYAARFDASQDGETIDPHDPDDVSAWAIRLGVEEEMLIEAAELVGGSPAAVRAYLA